MLLNQRWIISLALLAVGILFIYHRTASPTFGTSPRLKSSASQTVLAPTKADWDDGSFHWANVPQHYPLSSFASLPTGNAADSIPKIQHSPWVESVAARKIREERRVAVLGNFTHSWAGYKKYAWLKDEVGPLSGKAYDHYGGWAASLVDGLGKHWSGRYHRETADGSTDTLWIMGLTDEFEEAVAAISKIDFSTCALDQLNIFETTIRYMGGLLGAWDLSAGKYPILLEKVLELGEMVYKSFDTPNRMPITRWDFQAAKTGRPQQAPNETLIAEIGSLTLEMTRLSQVTGDMRFYDAVQRISDHLEQQQVLTRLPGLFPIVVNPRDLNFTEGNIFTLGGMVDSVYEYLPKQHLLLGGSSTQYRTLYERAMAPIRKHILYRPMTPDSRDILLAGEAWVSDDWSNPDIGTDAKTQHLSCFVGGMIALGAKAFSIPADLELARKAVDGCTWGYDTGAMGFMPEIMRTTKCPTTDPCAWDDATWLFGVDGADIYKPDPEELDPTPVSVDEKIRAHHLPMGVTSIEDTRYHLRPEAIESVFILYRITGDAALADKAWEMFENVVRATTTEIGAAALDDCTDFEAERSDRMESYWFAETLKYFYLCFEEPEVLSLDEWVLNTEAHPFRWRGG